MEATPRPWRNVRGQIISDEKQPDGSHNVAYVVTINNNHDLAHANANLICDAVNNIDRITAERDRWKLNHDDVVRAKRAGDEYKREFHDRAVKAEAERDALKHDIERLRGVLEDARRDMGHLKPRSDTGSQRAKQIDAAIGRIEIALATLRVTDAERL